MRSFRKKAVVGAGLALAIGFGLVSQAAASPEPTGWDDSNDILVGQGSDTTYVVQQKLTDLYNSAPGCDTDNVAGSANLGKCLTTGQTATDTKGNWDHDVVTQLYPTGSGAGLKALQLGQVDFARSSRGPKASGESDLNFWAFAKDGIEFTTFAGRPVTSITKAKIQGIYNCSITTWGGVYGTADATPIRVYGMNPSSGTKATMDTFLGFDANAGSCVLKLELGAVGPTDDQYPFENDAKQIIDDRAGSYDQDAFWWGSFAELKTYSYKRQSAEAWPVDFDDAGPNAAVTISNGTIANNTWAAKRFIYHVTKKADVTESAPGSTDLTGANAGKAGGVREYTEWTCKLTADHSINPFFGTGYFAEITSAINAGGFQRVPTLERTNGACKLEPGA